MAQKPSIPKGTRDFLPFQVNRRNYIYDTIKNVFKKYAFAPIETPSFELSTTLMGKYGEEGDRLIFRILNSGDKVKKADLKALEEGNLPKFANSLSEKALRYDLTVPFARFVVQHQNDLTFPFKRYQIQPVWRADRPQKGRYQEFYQCDADVVGSDSLLFEVDFIQIFDEVLSALKVPDFTVQINNRKILSGIAEVTGEEDKIIDITVAIDKLDKIGEDGVIKELNEKGVSEKAIAMIRPLFSLKGDTAKMLAFMNEFLAESEIGKKGIEELAYVFKKTEILGLKNAKLEFDVTLARGLNYYTGAIFEVKANGVNMGSICGGGRYDDLTGLFGMKDLSGVGISFGADRIYDVLTELELFPTDINETLEYLFINFGEKEVEYSLPILQQLRNNNVTAELYPDEAKLKKQFKYADDRNAKYAVIVGESELKNNEITIKEMKSGDQETMSVKSFTEKYCS
ncbi:histidine--tRNA ligase [Brumimicrobium glaciale]|uniref:Histidine--tRNA ligase n=1 Tax=Brumimicrobium glaciale TaxID=200475 RepID=A0A4Q4KS79_9FLAO|nr:histidine--tRNA ligase [Brumimicrobium glaciale]RYM34889.1 histidine--tRNA ligase [Brumimicrobium glaciale]